MNAKLGHVEPPGQDPSPPTTRVVAVVELLVERHETPSTLADICRELGISRSTGHAILQTLCSADWISRDPVSGRYTLGPGFPSTTAPLAPIPRLLRGPLEELCAGLGMAVCISEVRDGVIEVVDARGPGTERPHVPAGVRLPFVAPFGREFVAWASPEQSGQWLAAAGAVNDVYRTRMPKVLAEIRTRGYGIERLTDPLLRVYTALLALDDGDVPDAVSMRLAGAVADLTIVDVLPSEMSRIEGVSLATISAPIFDERGAVVMSVSAQPYRTLTAAGVRAIGERVVEFAETATALLTRSTMQAEVRSPSSF